MDKNLIIKLRKTFEEYSHEAEGVEFWYARELQVLLGYVEWRKFQGAIERAKESCSNSGYKASDHFVDAAKTIPMPKGASKDVPEVI